MTASHVPTPKPSSLLALLCLALLLRLRPAWAAVTVGKAAAAEGVSAERIARLASGALPFFERDMARLTRRGRPPADHAQEHTAVEQALTTELLAIATTLLQKSLRRLGPEARALILGAFIRLTAQYPCLTHKRFCAALAIPERTFRAWRTKTSAAPASPLSSQAPADTPKPKPKPSRRRGRFNFDVLLPDTQIAADTTDLQAFGVPLKLIATQDVGGRDQDLFDDILVDDHESAELVSDVLTKTLAELQGAQFITDQGTPYMAKATAAALDALHVEHAPQPEGAPTKKATIERAFLTIKGIAAPLLDITNRVASALPALRTPDLAKAAATLVFTALLRAYQAGARASRRAQSERGSITPEDLDRAAKNSREQARADDHSARLLLTNIHNAYGINMPLAQFLRVYRGCPIEVLHQADRAFAAQAHRDDIWHRAGYFRKLVFEFKKLYFARRACEQRNAEKLAYLTEIQSAEMQRRDHWWAYPAEWLAHALDLIAAQWLPERNELVAGGIGAGSAYVRLALLRLAELHGGTFAADTALGVIDTFVRASRPRIGDAGVTAVLNTLHRKVVGLPKESTKAATSLDWATSLGSAILSRTGPPRRPAPLEALRN